MTPVRVQGHGDAVRIATMLARRGSVILRSDRHAAWSVLRRCDDEEILKARGIRWRSSGGR
jgi:hypothetical protein